MAKKSATKKGKSRAAAAASAAQPDIPYVIRCAHTSVVGTHTLVPHPRNPNKHPDEQLRLLAKIMQHQGFRNPIVVSRRSGYVIKGHGRLAAAILNGWEMVPVDHQEYDNEADEWADMVADNRIAELAEPDLMLTRGLLEEMGEGFDKELFGYNDDGFAAMNVEIESIAPADAPHEDEDAEIPAPPKNPKTKTGDVWLLGDHRVMCGDSATGDVDALMVGGKADLLITDPPYGVSYVDARISFDRAIGNAIKPHKKIANDDHSPEDMYQFWSVVLVNAHHATHDRASYYVFSPQGGDKMMMMMSIKDAKWQLKHELVWVKNQFVLGRCDYHYKHEPVFYGWKEGCTHEFYGNSSCASVLEFDRPHKSDLHPTMKPVELCAYLMGNSSKRGGMVLDLFGGSGSTLIACEETGRVCRMMEKDEAYCDVIVERWENLTGKKAVRA